MDNLPRRSFLQTAAALLPFAAATAKGTRHLTNIGVELYTVRNTITKDPAGVLNAIEQIGYNEAELVYATVDAIWPSLEKTKLKPVSAHIDSSLFSDDSKLEATFEDVKKHSIQYVVYPYLPPPQRGGLAAIRKLADTLNNTGEKAKKLGLHLCYHNHAFEFEPMEGTTGFEELLKQTHKDLVSLELDVFWASAAGHDPVTVLKQHGKRIALVHLKDKSADLPVHYNETVPKDAFKEVGKGSLDFAAILRTAWARGIRHYFVEQDQTPRDPIDSLNTRDSYVKALRF